MSNFKDNAGRSWTFVCNMFTMARCYRETDIDLARAIEKDSTVIDDIMGDSRKFFAVLCSLLQDDMKTIGVDERALGEAISDEDVVIEATQALVRAIIDFFPKDRAETLRKAFDQLWRLTKEKGDAEADKAKAILDGMDWETMSSNIVAKSIPSSSEVS